MASHTSTPPAPPAGQKTGPMSHRQILEALTGLLAALFTAMVSSTIVANALPTIMSDLHGSQTDFAWMITGALLANAATTPIWGKLADLFDKKLLVQVTIVIFVAGSVLAGFAGSIPVLLAARVIQGVAMGGLTALVQAIIGTIISPRDRGRYSGFMGAVMAVATAGGPLLGGFIVDSPLGWRWTFFVCVPLAVVALVLLQFTLKLPRIKRPVKIDWLGSLLLTAGISLLLIWVSFAGKEGYYEWASGTTALMVGGSVVLLALLVLVESRAEQPVIPLKIITERTTALAIIASVAVGVAMFGSSTYLGQYFQVARGATPTEAGLLTLPMIAGNLVGSVVSGQLVSRYGKWKRYLILGTLLLIAGLGLAGTIDHTTDMWLVGLFTAVFGLGLGLLMQNLVLAVQNTVAAKDIGSASASVAFFRTVGGAAGVSVLGAVLGNQVGSLTAEGLAKAGIPVTGGGDTGSLDIQQLPAPVAEIVRAAYGDGTALTFTITAAICVFALVAVLFIQEKALRRTIDVQTPADVQTPTGAVTNDGGLDRDVDREFAGIVAGSDLSAPPNGREFRPEPSRRAAGRSIPLSEGALLAEAEAERELAAQVRMTQELLASQQLQLREALRRMTEETARQRAVGEQQARTAAQLAELAAELAHERELQKAAAVYLLQQRSGGSREKEDDANR